MLISHNRPRRCRAANIGHKGGLDNADTLAYKLVTVLLNLHVLTGSFYELNHHHANPGPHPHGGFGR